MPMKILRDFLDQDVERPVLVVIGNIVGAIGVIFSALTLWIAYILIRSFGEDAAGDLLVTGSFLFGSALLSCWLIRTAYRMVNDPGPQDRDWW